MQWWPSRALAQVAGSMETLAGYPKTVADQERPGMRPLILVALTVLAVTDGQVVTILRASDDRSETWSLPRRILATQESLEEAAELEARRCALDTHCYVEQLWTCGGVEVSSGERVLEVAYLALTPPPIGPPAGGGCWWPLAQLPPLSPGHTHILRVAQRRLEQHLAQGPLAWSLLPEEFTLSELQAVYEAVEGRTLDKRNFRKWALSNGLVQATNRERRDGAHRPARLYRFIAREIARAA